MSDRTPWGEIPPDSDGGHAWFEIKNKRPMRFEPGVGMVADAGDPIRAKLRKTWLDPRADPAPKLDTALHAVLDQCDAALSMAIATRATDPWGSAIFSGFALTLREVIDEALEGEP